MGKIDSSRLNVKPLHAEVDIAHFCCSEKDLNEYLKEDALKDHEFLYSITKVVEYQGEVIGYFTLVTDTINPKLVDTSIGIKYGYAKLPAVKIARLATDKNYMGMGVGASMMVWIFRIVLNMIGDVGCRVITVDAKKEAQEFYHHFSFRPVNSKSDKETVPMYIDIKSLIDMAK